MRLKAAIPGRNVLEVSFDRSPGGWQETLSALPGVETITGKDNLFRIASTNGPQTTLAMMEAAERSGIQVHSLAVQSTSLDDVFVHYTGHALRDALQEPSAADSPFMIRRGNHAAHVAIVERECQVQAQPDAHRRVVVFQSSSSSSWATRSAAT
jgi:hypothetical protein